jgi:hypothetical protein
MRDQDLLRVALIVLALVVLAVLFAGLPWGGRR